jgi:hypothetical protein
MTSKRDNFNTKTKATVAARVNYKCCFPNCSLATVGPSIIDKRKMVLLGEAAHIRAAARGGPRYLPEMTIEQRRSIDNAIWMCRMHSKIIDEDHGQYSAATLSHWKELAEAEAYQQLKNTEGQKINVSTTLVCLDLNLMFDAVWTGAEKDRWTFVVKKFVIGDEKVLKAFGVPFENTLNYVIVESQGEGRLISDFSWTMNDNGEYKIQVSVKPPTPRTNPNSLRSDIAVDFEGDSNLAKGDVKTVSGVGLAKQIIIQNLGMPIGSWQANVLFGSYFSSYFHRYRRDKIILNKLVKVELTRLVAIPAYQLESALPKLNFVNRVLEVEVLADQDGSVPVFLSLEWGDGLVWSDTLHVRLYDPNGELQQYKLPEFIKELYRQQPLDMLRSLMAKLDDEDLSERMNDKAVKEIFNDTLPQIMENMGSMLKSNIYPLFESFSLFRTINEDFYPFFTSVDFEHAVYKEIAQKVGITIELKGFKKAGTDAFDLRHTLFFYFNDYNYEIGTSKQNIWQKKLYNHRLDEKDIPVVSRFWIESFVKEINKMIVSLGK